MGKPTREEVASMAWGAGARLEGLAHGEALALACVEVKFRAPHAIDATLSP